MNCATFERDLARLLAGEAADPGALLAHAASCHDCAASRDLVEWGALPSLERFDDPVPGDVEWARFDRQLRGRIARDTERIRAARRRGAWVAAAAVCVAVLLGGWVLRDGAVRDRPVTVVVPADDIVDVDDVLDRWAGGGSADVPGPTVVAPASGWTVPGVEDLDAVERDELLDWLREETERLDGGQA